MAKVKFRYYMSKKKIVHKRSESWFKTEKNEEVYSKFYTRVNGMDDLTFYKPPNPKPKPKPKIKPEDKKWSKE